MLTFDIVASAALDVTHAHMYCVEQNPYVPAFMELYGLVEATGNKQMTHKYMHNHEV